MGRPLSDIVEHFLINWGGADLQRDLIDRNVGWQSGDVAVMFKDRLVPLLESGYFSEPVHFIDLLWDWWAGEYGLYPIGSFITGLVADPEDLGVFPLPGQEAGV